MVLFDDHEDNIFNQFFEVDDESDDDALILRLIAHDEEEERSKKRRHGSVPGCQVVHRDISAGNLRIVADYFSDVLVYNDKFFRRRFWMSRNLFLRIVDGVEAHDDYFRQRPNAAGLLGATALQKVVGSIRMLAYDLPADSMDEVVRIAKGTMIEAFKHFVRAVVDVYGDQYLRPPNDDDTRKLLASNGRRGWPSILGCIDCMHWR